MSTSKESFDVMFTTKITVEINTDLFTQKERDAFRGGAHKTLDLEGHARIVADDVMQRTNPHSIWGYGEIAYHEHERDLTFQVRKQHGFNGICVRRYEAELCTPVDRSVDTGGDI